MDDLFTEAKAGNAEIHAALLAVDIERARRAQLVLPPLQFDASARVEPDVPRGLGVLRVESATVTQQYGARSARLANQQASDAAIDASVANAAGTIRIVRQRIATAYYVLAAAQATRANAQEAIRIATEFERIARIRENAGDIGRFDLARTTLEVRRSQGEYEKAAGTERAAQISLNVLVGRPPSDVFSAYLAEGSPIQPEAKTLEAGLLLTDPQIRQLEAQIRSFSARERAAAATRRPTYALTAGVQTSSVFPLGTTAFGPVVAGSLSVTLGDRGTISGSIAEALAARRVAETQLAGRRLQLQGELAAAVASISATRERLRLSSDSREQAEALVKTALIGFRSGALSATDVLATRSSVTAARAVEIEAKGDYALALATLRLLLLP